MVSLSKVHLIIILPTITNLLIGIYTIVSNKNMIDLYNNKGLVEISLLRLSAAPWEDIKESLLPEFEQWKQRHIPG
jgi:hypothetical protein